MIDVKSKFLLIRKGSQMTLQNVDRESPKFGYLFLKPDYNVLPKEKKHEKCVMFVSSWFHLKNLCYYNNLDNCHNMLIMSNKRVAEGDSM